MIDADLFNIQSHHSHVLADSHTCLTIDVGKIQLLCDVISCILTSIEQQNYN